MLCAVAWALALVLFKRSGERVSPIPLNLFKNAVGLVLFIVTLVVTRDGIGNLSEFCIEDIYILVLSGVLGIAVADTIMFFALNRIGVGIISVVDCSYSPLVILASFLILAEELTRYHYVGGGLILAGVLTASRVKPPFGRTRLQLVVGMAAGVLAIAMMALGIALAKLVLDHFPLVWATTIRLGSGTAVLAVWALASAERKRLWSVFKPSTVWKASLPASILGTYVSLWMWMAGFKYTYASVAALLNQTSVVFALIFAALILKESLGRRKLVAIALALGGAVVVWWAQNRPAV